MLRVKVVGILLGTFFLAAVGLNAGDLPEIIKIDEKGYEKDKKGPVDFAHKKHADFRACIDCHHDYKDVVEKGEPVRKCSECHNPFRKEGKAIRLQYAYHKTCKKCHKTLAKAGKPAGPFKECGGCHKPKPKT